MKPGWHQLQSRDVDESNCHGIQLTPTSTNTNGGSGRCAFRAKGNNMPCISWKCVCSKNSKSSEMQGIC